jgi:hypothetical protein
MHQNKENGRRTETQSGISILKIVSQLCIDYSQFILYTVVGSYSNLILATELNSRGSNHLDLRRSCFGLVGANDATADMVGIYWVALVLFIIFSLVSPRLAAGVLSLNTSYHTPSCSEKKGQQSFKIEGLARPEILPASIDSNAFSCYKLGLVGYQECNELTNLLWLTNSSQACCKRVSNFDASLQECIIDFVVHATGLVYVRFNNW